MILQRPAKFQLPAFFCVRVHDLFQAVRKIKKFMKIRLQNRLVCAGLHPDILIAEPVIIRLFHKKRRLLLVTVQIQVTCAFFIKITVVIRNHQVCHVIFHKIHQLQLVFLCRAADFFQAGLGFLKRVMHGKRPSAFLI